jgi:hypothetical protein
MPIVGNKPHLRRLAFSILFLAIAAVSLFAQSPFGRITGRVMDSSGAVVVGATVRVLQIETNIATATATSSNGVYDLQNLLPGNYRINVEMAGFKSLEQGPVEVRVSDVLRLDFTLQVGSQQETITVSGEAPLLQSETASMGQLVDNRSLNNMPLGGRALTYLMQTAPGIITTSPPSHGWLPQARGYVSSLASAGTATNANEFSLDGIPNQDTGGTIMFIPPPEMIQEVRVQTAAYDASIGHYTGSHVDMVVKAGTNEYHGNLYFSDVNRKLMSNPFFVNRALYDASTGPPTKQKRDALFPYNMTNRYRGSLGGPVFIPKLYDGHNRTFFSYGYERMLRLTPSSGPATVPTLAERTGDFSALLAIGSQYQIYDPRSAAPAPGGRVSRLPLPGNRIPSSSIDPVAQQLLSFYPVPNATGTVDGRENYFSSLSDRISYASHMLRVDQVISERQRLYATFSTFWINADQGRTFHNNAVGGFQEYRPVSLTVDDVITPRPDLVVDLRYGYSHNRGVSAPVSAGLDLATLGFSPTLLAQVNPTFSALPTIAIDGLNSLNGSTFSKYGRYFHSFAGSLSHTRGAHTLRAGSEFRVIENNSYNPGMVVPSLTFSTNWTRGPLDSSAAAPIGQGLASFLLGLPTDGYKDINDSFAEMSRFMGLYFQDDWKVTKNLTINAGLRYEVEWPTTERFNRANRGFDFSAVSPIQAAAQANYAGSPIPELPASAFRTSGGLLFAGVSGVPRGLWDADKNNFLPRVGLAYKVRSKVVLRAGYGIFFETFGVDRNDVLQQGFNQRNQMVPSLDNGLSFRATLGNPFPDGLLQPAGAAQGLRTFLGNSVSFFPPWRRPGYAQRWSFGTQYELPHRIMIEVGYMGTRGTGLGMSRSFDALPEQYLSKSPVRDQTTINLLTSQVDNPFFGLPEFNGTGLQGRKVARQQLLLPMPQFAGVSGTVSDGFSWYHAAEMRMEKRLSRGYTVSGTYTWSKYMQATQTLNPSDLTPTHVISSMDRPHHLAATGTWDLPWARTRLWGGWSLSAIYQWQSGSPIGFGNVIFNGKLADLVLPRSQRRAERWFNTDAGFNRIPAQQLAYNLRTFPLLLTGLRTQNWNNWDVSVIKNFRIRERLNFELRGEAVDAFNTPIFAAPNTTPTSTLFGQVTNTIWSEQRKITLVGKLSW